MSVVYQDPLVTLYQGDVLKILREEWDRLWPIQTVITVPPWVRYATAQSLVDGRVPWGEKEEGEWQAIAVAHYANWLPVLVTLIADSAGRIWLIVHQCYVGACLRVAYMRHWRTPQIWSTPGSELVIVQIGERVSANDRSRVQEALDDASNPMENDALLRTLVAVSGGPVMDPFCGTARTLQAARACRTKAIGIEIRPESCTVAIERLRKSAA